MSNALCNQLHSDVDSALKKGYEMFITYLGETAKEKYFAVDKVFENYKGEHLLNLCVAAQSLYWFFKLHDEKELTSEKTLLGDYFFSQFSLSLIPIDSTKLIDTFSDFIKQSVVKENFDKQEFENFISKVHEAIDD